jgi:hypothetical protein
MKTAIDIIAEAMSEEDRQKYKVALNEAHRKNFSDIRDAHVHANKYTGPLARNMAEEYYSTFFGQMDFFKF